MKTVLTYSPAKPAAQEKKHIIHSPAPRKMKKLVTSKQMSVEKRTLNSVNRTVVTPNKNFHKRPVLTPRSFKRRNKRFFKDPPADSIRVSCINQLQNPEV